jgi:3-oxoacyl-[acyl-carrier-protein] synthase-3
MFGDAATATLISCEKMDNGLNAEILEFCYGTDGSQFDSLIVKNGFAKHFIHDGVDQFDEEGNFVRNDDHLYMDGKAIFNFTAFEVPPLIEATLKKNHVLLNDIDQFIFHQANEFMLKTVRKRCGISENKFFIDIKELGNTVSNTIPIAICKAEKNGFLKNAHYILLSGFGVGLSMGAVVLRR